MPKLVVSKVMAGRKWFGYESGVLTSEGNACPNATYEMHINHAVQVRCRGLF